VAEVDLSATVPGDLAGLRLDRALATMFPHYSRARLQGWLRSGEATVDGAPGRPRDRVRGGERVRIRARVQPSAEWEPEPIPLRIVHEDEHLLVVDKPAGLVVHPGAGNPAGTLVNALLAHDPAIAAVPRAGVVHRLDKDTSGLLVVARTLSAHRHLVEALRRRRVRRDYEVVVHGRPVAGGRIDAPLGRDPARRTRMAVRGGGRPAVTHFRVLARFRAHSHVAARLETGRTHQIRVHLAHAGHPVVGDPAYGRARRATAGAAPDLACALAAFSRQALHARRLALEHPSTGAPLAFESPLPADIRDLLSMLRADAAREGGGEA